MLYSCADNIKAWSVHFGEALIFHTSIPFFSVENVSCDILLGTALGKDEVCLGQTLVIGERVALLSSLPSIPTHSQSALFFMAILQIIFIILSQASVGKKHP